MARPRHDNPVLFVAGELAEATGFTLRNVQYLRDNRLGPFGDRFEGLDHGNARYSEDVVAELAMIAGVFGAGFPLVLAAQIVAMFLSEHPNHPAARFALLDSFVDMAQLKASESWFHAFEGLHGAGRDAYRTGQVLDHDMLLLIADREKVLQGHLVRPRLPALVGDGVDPEGPMPLGEVVDLEKSREPKLIPWYADLERRDPEPGEDEDAWFQEHRAAQTAIDVAYQKAAREAVAVSRINISLAIRRGFERVRARRLAKGGPFFATHSPPRKASS